MQFGYLAGAFFGCMFVVSCDGINICSSSILCELCS